MVIVGGGAGGLELATGLGNRLGKKHRADITLIDTARTHIWKPLLHEVAAGTLDSHEDELEYLAQAHHHRFRFRLGYVDAIDQVRREVLVAPTLNERQVELIPRRRFHYDTLVLAVGSISNDFGIPGVAEHCLFLDTTSQAERFQKRLLEAFLQAHAHGGPGHATQLHVAIVGGGATGVELAAQLHEVANQFAAYGMDQIDPTRDIRIHLIEGAERILPALPARLSDATMHALDKLGIKVHTGQRVVRIDEDGIHTGSDHYIPCGLKVWAAGIKAPDFLHDVDGLETNVTNQVLVTATLQSTTDERIFAIGDCAACPWPNHDQLVPPRAQAAHQQASLLVKSLTRLLNDKPLPMYRYHDYGSLVSLGQYSTVGNLMGKITGSFMVEGYIARFVYLSLYKMHQVALFGLTRAFFLSLANIFRRAVHPNIKLH
ncbi:MAG: NAD(P)/FAD-dependent oxidoreductase [Gammaproteobacteria bacterium]|nr:NAD(P)/FAD-dependent oxidoreductase [Gammaproteobacteria bacterium]